MTPVIIILITVSAVLSGVVGLTIFKKKPAVEEKLDKVAMIIKTGIDALVDRMPDGLTATEIGEIVAALVKSAKEEF